MTTAPDRLHQLAGGTPFDRVWSERCMVYADVRVGPSARVQAARRRTATGNLVGVRLVLRAQAATWFSTWC